ncbi:sensor histidine kinase [Phenylobacterium sp. VNQ135]|uniref:sensor histidine kinase n=1 Tax=Phenylobacterium sp. VNQ135 TaxID=3400922 RepID=UPI003C109E40
MPPAAHLRPASAAARPRRDNAPDEQKRSFLRMASHELRTPLNSILGFSEILSSELYGPLGAPQYKEYAEIIQRSGQKLLKLVNQVLEIARLEAQTMDFDLRSEPLDLALDDAMAGLGDELAGLTVEVAGRGELPAVTADPRGLRTVLFHLLQNAAAFSPEGGVIFVSAQRLAGGVQIVVRDQGAGVDPAELPRLMNPFEQGENALTRRGEGAGLGLPIADLTCKAMGGRLTLASKPGKGLTAGVRLPAG